MAFAHAVARQLARPAGLAGRLLAPVMDLANRTPTRLALDLLSPSAGETVLDAGCGTGAALQALLVRADCRATGVDQSATMIAAARRRLHGRAGLVECQLERLPFAEGAFDAVLALNVLYFTDRDGAMIGELRRVLRPGGRLVAYVTEDASMEQWPFVSAGLHRLYDAASLKGALIAAGFAPEAVTVHVEPVAGAVMGLFAVASR
jgi:ubiquinone/menaquinone biosynthesis C-methylase UbiE